MNSGSTLGDDGGSEVTVTEAADHAGHRQALSVRVGPVYYSGRTIASGPAIWVTYQPEYLRSQVEGPVLMDFTTWKALDKAVRKRVRRWRRGYLRERWYRVTHPDLW